MFGGGSSSSSSASSCCCNGDLSEHLKTCAGMGNLPPLIEKCDDIPGPGFRDRCPRSTCQDKEECFACGQTASPKQCDSPKPSKCEPKEDKQASVRGTIIS
jgi:hypothetical protein